MLTLKEIVTSRWFITLMALYMLCVNHVGKNQIGLRYSAISRQNSLQDSGWEFTFPWEFVSYVPKNAIVVSREGIGGEGLDVKVIKFKPGFFETFLKKYPIIPLWPHSMDRFWNLRRSEYGTNDHKGVVGILGDCAFAPDSKNCEFLEFLGEIHIKDIRSSKMKKR